MVASVMEKSWNFWTFEIFMEFCDTVMEKSWNFVATISEPGFSSISFIVRCHYIGQCD